MHGIVQCSDQSAELAEPLAGTAGVATRYLAIEQGGPWGRDALHNSDLDHDLADQIAQVASKHDVKTLMIRRPGRHSEHAHRDGRAIYAASVTSGAAARTQVIDPAEILDFDWSAFAHDDPAALSPKSEIIADPVVLVCAHSKRDLCCAVKGRPLARQLREAHGKHVWECSHLGGHRFAATALILQSGATYGRLDASNIESMYDAARRGTEIPELLRGMSALPKPAQAADVALRLRAAIVAPFIAMSADGDRHEVQFGDQHRAWTVSVQQHVQQPSRPESCGKSPANPTAYRCLSITTA